MHKKFNQQADVGWGELLRIQEEIIELNAIEMRRRDQALRVSGMFESVLRRKPVDVRPIITPEMDRAA